MEDAELKLGKFTFKGWYVAAALPILSGISGAVYFAYDNLQRFNAMEANLAASIEAADLYGKTTGQLKSRLQTLEQAVEDNDVRGLNTKLASISTQMQTILEQQRVLLDLRSQVEKSSGITDGIDEQLKVLKQEIEDIWKAYDSLVDNPL